MAVEEATIDDVEVKDTVAEQDKYDDFDSTAAADGDEAHYFRFRRRRNLAFHRFSNEQNDVHPEIRGDYFH